MKRCHQLVDEFEGDSSYNSLQSKALPSETPKIEGYEVEDVVDVYKYLNSVRQEADIVSTTFHQRPLTSPNLSKQSNPSESSPPIDKHEKGNQNPSLWKKVFLTDFLSLKAQINQTLPHEQPSEIWPQPQNISSWRKCVMETLPPSFRVIYHQFDHITAIKLIVHFTSWLSGTTNENFSKWIYLLLLRVDNLLDHNDCSIIRGLGKKAIKLLNAPDRQYSETASYTFEFIILVVKEYYKQVDIEVESEM